MCGIAGIVNFDGAPVSEELLARMNSALVHRGPDGSGIWKNCSVGLVHRRLSIIDLAGGGQPLSNEDGSILVTYNGEIYNHREIRKNLEAKGHVFKTNCDTEVIVHAYEEYGADCVGHLNGMFAFGIYDAGKRKLFLARDRMGQKPLVYFHSQKVFVFASELQALCRHPAMPREISPQAVHDYLSLQYIPCPDTIYLGVRKLPPAHILELDCADGKTYLRRYWDCRFDLKRDISFEKAKIGLYELLEDAVKIRLMSDVPLGAFLSGGIDSTLIVGLMSKFSGSPVKTFTIGFGEKKYDERRFAKIASARFVAEHREKIVNPANFAVLEKLVRHYGEPYSDASMLPTYLLSEFTREKVTVALSGDGADELFGGYYRYLVMKFAKFADFIPASFRKPFFRVLSSILPPKTEERSFFGRTQRILQTAAADAGCRYFELIDKFGEGMKRNAYGEKLADFSFRGTQEFLSALYRNSSAENPVEKIMETDVHSYLHGDILTKIDIASMACSLELRSPFMDYRIAEFTASLPFSFKQSGKIRKRILRETFRELIPSEILNREKLGFGVPVAIWFRNEWADILRERLLEGGITKSGYFRREYIEKLIYEHKNYGADNSYALWALLVFELWMESSRRMTD